MAWNTQVYLVSSIEAGDLDLSATKAEGVRQLYRYLDFAARGHAALELDLREGASDFESPFEEEVAGFVRSLGYEVSPQVGCSQYRVDLGVSLPDKPGRFILGIECDGAMYHSAHTARDRDRLRQEVLERLGWRIHRIWSPEWVSRRDVETKRLRDVLERAARRPMRQDTKRDDCDPGRDKKNVEVERCIRSEYGQELNHADCSRLYEVYKPKRNFAPKAEIHEEDAKSNLRKIVLGVVQTEGPVHVDIVVRRTARAWGIARAGNRVEAAVAGSIKELCSDKRLTRKGKFLSLPTAGRRPSIRRPDPAVHESVRGVEHIPPQEIEEAISVMLKHALSLPEEDLMSEVARLFGFRRTGKMIRSTLKKAITRMVRKGRLARNNGKLELPPAATQ